jgi:restriction endonuclease
MKLHFEPNLDYQHTAIEAVCDLFRGQETCRTEFTVVRDPGDPQYRMVFAEHDLGIGNRLQLLDDEILANLSKIQIRNGLRPSDSLASGDFTVEMETGTGKTYVYLRTIFELNRRYGFTKFVIVVPSVAIKEGVYHSIEIAEDHLRSLYANAPFEYFLYDSSKLGQVRNFATSPHIQIMVVTVGAINKKDVNNLYKDSEKTGGEKPIDLIKVRRPILIVDEPQSVDGGLGGRGKEALGAMNPLCTLRYSATHVDKHHMLFRLDAVDKYRQYDVEGNKVKGEYARIFEEEYRRLAQHPDYMTLFQEVDLTYAAEEVHDGYFSIDKKGTWTDTAENNQGSRENAERAYTLIMKDKERLLSFETPLKFIFSHSALKEGWDNPNVFQICALREMRSEGERRQTIGRGLRLCVNQQGDRLRGFEINTLTVVATEGYERFAENLQKEIEADTGIRFGIVEKHQFAAIPVTDEAGRTTALGIAQSEAIWAHLKNVGYVDAKGEVRDHLRQALKEGTLHLPEPFQTQLPEVTEILRKLAGRLEIKNADERRQVKTRQAVLHSEKFQALWNRIKHRTTYRVQFDNQKLLTDCAKAIRECPPITKTRLQWRKADLGIGKAGVEATETAVSAPVALEEHDIELPDLLTDLQDKTQLTPRSIVRILTNSGRLDDFKRNPQQFIELATESINRTKRLALVDGIKYQRLGDEYYYAQELFEDEELTGYLKNMLASGKSAYEQVVYDLDTERTFADQLEKNEAIKVYAKLPGWFKVPTPLGTYNPDWAVLVEKDGAERLYFVVETKSSLFTEDLRGKESAKIECGKAHFKALAVGESPAQFIQVTGIDDLMAKC